MFAIPVVEPGNSQSLAKLLLTFAEGAGKEAGDRRNRLRQGIGLLAEFFRAAMHTLAGAAPNPDTELQWAAATAAKSLGGDLESVAALVERCLEAVEQIDRNAHQTMIVEALCDDLGKSAALRASLV